MLQSVAAASVAAEHVALKRERRRLIEEQHDTIRDLEIVSARSRGTEDWWRACDFREHVTAEPPHDRNVKLAAELDALRACSNHETTRACDASGIDGTGLPYLTPRLY